MAVNYGLGGFEQGSAFFAAYNNTEQSVIIGSQNVYVGIRTYSEVNLGQEAGDFSSNYHLVKENLGQFQLKTDGVFLISYNITTGQPQNETIGFAIFKNTTEYAQQLGYCRSGDFFEVGSQALVYANKDDVITFKVKNTDSANDVKIHNINVSIVKLKYGGRING
jgi:hypothetical protein